MDSAAPTQPALHALRHAKYGRGTVTCQAGRFHARLLCSTRGPGPTQRNPPRSSPPWPQNLHKRIQGYVLPILPVLLESAVPGIDILVALLLAARLMRLLGHVIFDARRQNCRVQVLVADCPSRTRLQSTSPTRAKGHEHAAPAVTEETRKSSNTAAILFSHQSRARSAWALLTSRPAT